MVEAEMRDCCATPFDSEHKPECLGRVQADPFEEMSEGLREAGFTGIHMIGDYQFTICRQDGTWLQLSNEPVPPDEFFTFETTWIERHQINTHPHSLDWVGGDEIPVEQHRPCKSVRCRDNPHAWKGFEETRDGNVITQWNFCPGLSGSRSGYPARTSQRRDR